MSKLKKRHKESEKVTVALSAIREMKINEIRELVMRAGKLGIELSVRVANPAIEEEEEEDVFSPFGEDAVEEHPEQDEIHEEISEEEMQQLSEVYGYRTKPDQEWIKVRSDEDIFDLLMREKEKNGWKFKDEA